MSQPAATDQTDWVRPLYARQVEMLGELAEAGLEIALTVKDQAKAKPEQAAELFAVYAQVARAVRLSLMLQTEVIKRLEAHDSGVTLVADNAARWTKHHHEQDGQRRKANAEGVITRVAERSGANYLDTERFVREGREHLDREILHGQIMTRPFSELVAAICKDLGLDPDWPRLAEEAWAREEMASDAVGWPLAGLNPDPLIPANAKTRIIKLNASG